MTASKSTSKTLRMVRRGDADLKTLDYYLRVKPYNTS